MDGKVTLTLQDYIIGFTTSGTPNARGSLNNNP